MALAERRLQERIQAQHRLEEVQARDRVKACKVETGWLIQIACGDGYPGPVVADSFFCRRG